MADADWRKLLTECLDSTIVGSLATVDDLGPWSCPIYSIYDKDFNIYFISNEVSRHILNIRENPRVGISIYDPQKAVKNVQLGVEIRGVASEVPGEKIDQVYSEREKRITRVSIFEPEGHEGHFIKSHSGVFIMIKPVEIKYVNTEAFDGEAQQVPIGKL